MERSVYTVKEKLTSDQVDYIKSGLLKISARMTTEQIGELADALHDIRRVRCQHKVFRSINRWA